MENKNSGVVAITNLLTGKKWLYYANDIISENAEMRFQLDLGLHPCAELQKDYSEIGLELFCFETLLYTNDINKVAELKKITENLYK